MLGWKIKVKTERKLIDIVAAFTGSKKKAKKLIDEGLICVNYRKIPTYRTPIRPKSIVCIPNTTYLFKKTEIKILYEDETIIVVNKPPFLNSNVNKPNVEEILRKQLKFQNLFVVHRLDKQTSGVLIIAKDRKIFEKFKEVFRQKQVKKIYKALILGTLKKEKGKVNFPVSGKPAFTIYEVEEKIKNLSTLVRVEIPTGRKHQIRIHFSRIGHPVVGEFLYWKNWKGPLCFAPRIMLHAYSLSFTNPITKKEVKVKSSPPSDISNFIEKIKTKGEIKEIEV